MVSFNPSVIIADSPHLHLATFFSKKKDFLNIRRIINIYKRIIYINKSVKKYFRMTHIAVGSKIEIKD